MLHPDFSSTSLSLGCSMFLRINTRVAFYVYYVSDINSFWACLKTRDVLTRDI